MLLSELQGGSPPCNSLQRNPLRPGFSSGSASERTQGSWVRRHRLSLLYHPGWRAAPLPAGEPDRGTRLGWNDHSLGICYEGGLDERGLPADTRTYAQRCTLLDLLRQLRRDYPSARILGHYQLSTNIRKACPASTRRKNINYFEDVFVIVSIKCNYICRYIRSLESKYWLKSTING